jgi:hypothetical protein
MASLDFREGLSGARGPGGLAGCSSCTVRSNSGKTGPVSKSDGLSITGLSGTSTTEGLGDVLGGIISGTGSLNGSWNTYINGFLY